MNAYWRSGGVAPFIPATLTAGKVSPYPLNSLGGHHSLCGLFGEEKNNLALPGFERCIIPLVTESRYRLRYFGSGFQLVVTFHGNVLLLS